MVEGTVIDWLLSDAAVVAAVGTRVWGKRIPQRQDLPCITVVRTGGRVNTHMKGVSTLRAERLGVECWGLTEAEVAPVAAAVRGLLTPEKTHDVTRGSFHFRGIFPDEGGEADGATTAVHGDDGSRFFASQDYTAWFRPAGEV